MLEGTARRLGLLGGLYTIQGIVFGFTTAVLVPSLTARGASVTEQAGLIGLASLPWVFKLPTAVLLDRWKVGPRGLAAAAMGAMAAVLGVLAMLGDPQEHLGLLGGLWLVLNALLAMQDVAADTLALDGLAPAERGSASGVMFGGHQVGNTAVGAMALGAVVGAWDLQGGLWCMAGLVFVAAVVTRSVRVPRAVSESPPADTPRRAEIWALLGVGTTWAVGGFAGCFLLADVLTNALVGEFLINELRWPAERIYGTLAVVVFVGQVVGYAVASFVVDRIGHARATGWGSASLGGLWLAFAAVPGAWSSTSFMYGFVVVQLVATALMYVGLYAWLMGRVEPRFRASHYAVLTSLLNLPRAWVPWLAPLALAGLGFTGLYAGAGLFQMAMAGLLVFVVARGDTTGRPT